MNVGSSWALAFGGCYSVDTDSSVAVDLLGENS